MTNNIEITNSAEVYLKKLIDAKDEDNLGIRIFIDKPGTPKAETCLAFCNISETSKDDEVMHLELIDVYIDAKSVEFLKDAIVNFDEDNFDGQLTIKAPQLTIEVRLRGGLSDPIIRLPGFNATHLSALISGSPQKCRNDKNKIVSRAV